MNFVFGCTMLRIIFFDLQGLLKFLSSYVHVGLRLQLLQIQT